jgi:hypothetical protein
LLFNIADATNFASLALSIIEDFQLAIGVTASLVMGSEVPLLFIAVTAKVYVVPFFRPLTVYGLEF